MKLAIACGGGGLSSRLLFLGRLQGRSLLLSVAPSSSICAGRPGRSAIISQWRQSSVQSESDGPRIAAEDNPFVKPLSNVYHVVPCRFCKGSGEVNCNVCNGQGSLARGGFHKRNPVSLVRIVGSKWTAMESTFGWRHFHVNSKRKGPGKEWFLEMVSTCDDTTRFWVNAQNLKDRERWSAGWLQKEELMGLQDKAAATATVCKACKGRRTMLCRTCTESAGSGHRSRALDIIDV